MNVLELFNLTGKTAIVTGGARGLGRQAAMALAEAGADGVKVGLEYREDGVPLLCLETALPAKFEESIVEALGRPPERPAGYEAIEALPQRFEVMDADVDEIKGYIARYAG